jgi:LysW-gamma-L-lysine carboxypeptidase
VELLHRLVEIPSVSGTEGDAVAHLVVWMAEHGMNARMDAAGNAVGVIEAAPGEPGQAVREIVLLGHIDTVPGYPPVAVRDGRLYGRGAVDAKGPLAAFAVAAAMAGSLPRLRVVVVGAVEEETATSRGARQIARDRRPDLCVIGEPTGWQRAALGYKGRLLADLTVSRALSHRAGPDATACELAFAFWGRVRAGVDGLNDGRERAWEQVQANIRSFRSEEDGITEAAHMEMGFRLPPGYGPDDLKAMLEGLKNGHDLTFRGAETAFRADKNNALVRAFLASVRGEGGEPGFVVKTGTSDMNVVGPSWGCPILAYGPGDSALDHTPEEHVELEEWQRGVSVLAGMLHRLGEKPPKLEFATLAQ